MVHPDALVLPIPGPKPSYPDLGKDHDQGPGRSGKSEGRELLIPQSPESEAGM